ncbi:AraC family transcriptional regulator [Breznakia sp. OttesenSCG-928-G09]|nr:AraC family transcriptional regulator [Breznakia sp. OttesenSCG-928-G09]
MNTALIIEPCEALKPYIAHYTLVDKTVNNTDIETLTLIPDASGCLIYMDKDDKQAWYLWGATTKVVEVPFDVELVERRFFVEFLPQGLYHLLYQDMHELLDKELLVEQVDVTLHHFLQTLPMQSKDIEAILEPLEQYLMVLMKSQDQNMTCKKFIEIANEHHGNITVKKMSERLSISERQLYRLCNTFIGMSAKQYLKISRINYMLQKMQKDGKNLNLDDFGMYDQAHYNKIFKEICGVNPTTYLSNEQEFYNELYKFKE